jgi:hypothetical protein
MNWELGIRNQELGTGDMNWELGIRNQELGVKKIERCFYNSP